MKCLWQGIAIFSGVTLLLGAEPAVKPFKWEAPKVQASIFSQNLGLLDTERDQYATDLAIDASNRVALGRASAGSLVEARRSLALALQLSPRNKRAVVVNFQLSKGLVPEVTDPNYNSLVLARLILTRGQLLEKQGGDENQCLARYFIQLSAELDPKNEDAVYASELQRLDHGSVDWSALAEPKVKP